MFKIKSKETNNIYIVYGTQEIRGEIYFLIYNSQEWFWTNATQFEPYEENNINIPYVPIPYYPYPPSNIPNTPIDDWWKQPYVTWTASNNKTE